MKNARVTKGKRPYKILKFLKSGPKTHRQIAEYLGINERTYNYDLEELRKSQKRGDRLSPPRNNIKMYPGVSVMLGYLARRHKGNPEDGHFMELYKPLITRKENKYFITKYGNKALEVADNK